jgi:hypothetical protein
MKFMRFSRSPATAAAGSGVLIVTALVGVILAAGNAGGPAASAAASAPAGINGAPLVLPSACAAVRLRQPCDAAVVRPRHTKARRRQTQPVVAPTPTPTAITPTNPAQP